MNAVKTYKKQKKSAYKNLKFTMLKRIGNSSGWGGDVVKRKITVDFAVFMVAYTGNANLLFGFNNIPDVVTDIFGGLTGSRAYLDQLQSYNYFMLTGVKLQYQKSLYTQLGTFVGQPIVSIPGFSFYVEGTNGSTNGAYNYENAQGFFINPLNNDSKPASKYYDFPLCQVGRDVTNNDPNVMIGPIWQSANIGENGKFYLTMGFPTLGLLGGNASNNGQVQIGTLNVTFYTRWMGPRVV